LRIIVLSTDVELQLSSMMRVKLHHALLRFLDEPADDAQVNSRQAEGKEDDQYLSESDHSLRQRPMAFPDRPGQQPNGLVKPFIKAQSPASALLAQS
jgi:hypothetical protein